MESNDPVAAQPLSMDDDVPGTFVQTELTQQHLVCLPLEVESLRSHVQELK